MWKLNRFNMSCLVVMQILSIAAVRADSVVVFNEIMYHPANQADDTLEWIELYNQMSYNIDLTGWEITGGIDYAFPKGTVIYGGGYLVIARNPSALQSATGYTGALGPFSGNLSNGGEIIRLRNNSRRVMDLLDYNDEGAWPVAADGSGVSLAKMNCRLATGDPANWKADILTGGSPGSENFPAGQIQQSITLLDDGAATKAFIPSDDSLGLTWTNIAFDDSEWSNGTSGVGYERSITEDYTPLIGLDVESQMYNQRFSCFGRFAFTVNTVNDIDRLWLQIRYDDGFVAYLNGQEVASVNAPTAPVGWNVPATASHEAVAFEQIDLTGSIHLLQNGTNVLAIHGLNRTIDSSDFLILPRLSADTVTTVNSHDWKVRFNEIRPVSAPTFALELLNNGTEPVDLSGCTIACRGTVTADYIIPNGTLAPGAFLMIDENAMGFRPAYEDRLFLYSPTGDAVFDAAVVKNSLIGRSPDGTGDWLYPSAETLGSANSFIFNDQIVINEIMYHSPSGLSWIELYNRSSQTVDLSGWKISEGIEYEFPPGTMMEAGDYLVIAEDADAMRQTYLFVSNITGDFSKSLSKQSDRIVLKDSAGNPVDYVTYHDEAPWPDDADGYGSSLELRNPWADNAHAQAWAASDEVVKSQWQTFIWRGYASQSFQPNFWNELVIGMLESGEVLLDDISVVEYPDGAARQFMQNGDFESGDDAWRFCGNHRHSEVIVDENDPSNHVLRLAATGPTESYLNHIETTYGNSETVMDGQEYEISFRAKWQSGSNQLNVRLYFARLAKTIRLDVPSLNGTPGQQNSCYEANSGPTLSELSHSPLVPTSSDPVQITVQAYDKDSVDSCVVWWSVNGSSWNSTTMTNQGNGQCLGTIPAQSANSVVQFYVEAQDTMTATSMCPAEGPASRALYKVINGTQPSDPLHNFKLIMTEADVNFMFQPTEVMSNDRKGGTVICDGKDVYYDVQVRFKGSPAGRPTVDGVGFNIQFPADQLYRGVHPSVAVDRSGRSPVNRGQDEIYVKHMFNAAGIPCMYDDLIYFDAPRSDLSQTAILQMARYSSVFVESQWPDGEDGTVFEFDTIYYPRQTVDGNPESLKITSGTSFAQTDFTDLGNDKEMYRSTWQIENNRREDDYSGIIELCQTMGPTVPTEQELRQVMDVDQWMRCFALQRLCGIADTYMDNLNHNLAVYVPEGGGPTVSLPWDMDFVFYRGWNSALWNTSFNLGRIIEYRPGCKRLYYGHLRDLVTHTFNTTYMNDWLAHYSSLLPGQDFTGRSGYIQNRGQYALSQLPTPAVPFEITDSDMTVDDSVAVINGQAWVDVREVYIDGRSDPLELSWSSTGSGTSQKFFWQANVPVDPGVNHLVFEAYGFQGELLFADTITVTSTFTERPLRQHLRITELMYDPVGGSDFEFIELSNTGTETLDLTHVVFTDGITFSFADSGVTSMGPGQVVVIVKDLLSFSSRYNTAGMTIAGEYSGKLSNDGEKIRMQGQWNAEILSFAYSDGRGWPLAADGAGHSLVPKSEFLDDASAGSLDYGDNWTAGQVINGTPGTGELPVDATVVMNELAAHTDLNNPAYPDHDSNDWIELYNTTDSTITLTAGQWFLSDDKAVLDKWAIPQTQIPAYSYVSFDEITGFHNPITQGFGLNKAGEQVYLSYLPGLGDGRVVDCIRFKGQANGRTFGRYPDGGTYWHELLPTPDETNSQPQNKIMITEIMYNPLTGQKEYIELFNNTDTDVELWDSETNTGWRIDGEITYTFDQAVVIGAKDYLIVADFEPNAVNQQLFESHYGPVTVPLVGPFTGNLSNVTGRVALERPQAPDDVIDDISWIIVDESIYFDQGPWDLAADGTGQSLQRVTPAGSSNNPVNFKASAATIGSEWIPPADMDADGKVNLVDVAVFGAAWMAQEGGGQWNDLCNIVSDNSVIDWQDLYALLEYWLWESEF